MLQWGITGSLLTYLPIYFAEQKVDPERIGQLMAVAAVGLLIAPVVVGQICDRWLASEKYLAIAHFLGGVLLLMIPKVAETYRQTQANFPMLLGLIALYACAYFPTIPLASSLSFRHLPHADEQFGSVRIWGTVGWVLAGLSLSVWLGQRDVFAWLHHTLPPVETKLRQWFSALGRPKSSDAFTIAAVLSFALSAFSVFLPRTPPLRSKKNDDDAVAMRKVLRLFKDGQFTLLIVVSVVLAIVVPFYSYAVPTLLKHLGVNSDWVPAVMTIGQISEFPCLMLLHVCLRKWGAKWTFALGMLAWLVRYAMFAGNLPVLVVLLGVSLHGVCHVFLIIVVQLYVDRRCDRDVRASAQNLFAFLTMGVALPIGFLLAGKLGSACELNDGLRADYTRFFAIPAITVGLVLLIFWRFSRLSLQEKTEDQATADAHDS